jgi:hypothetical protein
MVRTAMGIAAIVITGFGFQSGIFQRVQEARN